VPPYSLETTIAVFNPERATLPARVLPEVPVPIITHHIPFP